MNHVQRHVDPNPPAVEEEPVEGLYSTVPSRVSSMAGTPCNIAFYFISPPNGKLRSTYGYAGIWDSGQLTSNHVVIRKSVFNFWFGDEMEPYDGVRIEGAGGDLLDLVGKAKIGLAISGFSTIKPKIVDVLICNDLGPGFLVGRKVLNDWNLSIHYKDGTETWQAG